MKNNMKCKFEECLTNYQEDLRRIVGKHLNHNLKLTVGDVVSTVNLQLIKTKQKFFDRFGYNFKKADFNRWAYAYARNNTKWGVIKSIEDNKELADGTFQTEDGERTLFEIVCESEGEEDIFFEEFDAGAKLKVIENIINKYSHILSPNEKNVFAGLLHGKSELQMSEDQGVTRQAINLAKIRVLEKVRAHYNFSVEDVSNVSPEQMEVYIDDVLSIFNKAETRRLKHHSTTDNPNTHPYQYAMD